MFLELQDNNLFKKQYFDLLKYQLTRGSLQLEGIDAEAITVEQSMKVYNQLSAINYMFDRGFDNSYFGFTELLCEVAKYVSGGEINDFRKTRAIVNGSNVERSRASMIRNDLWYLIYNYNYLLSKAESNKDLFKVEAFFHIRFLHIHPFEDGNGRTARILLTYNLAKHNLAPCIITMDRKTEYCDYIENSNEEGLAKLFEELSLQELKTMIAVYTDMDKRGLIETNKMSDEQEMRLKNKIRYIK